jgi:NADH dehydrogenase (ubiquinone) 1 alpha subcomplex subunit 9
MRFSLRPDRSSPPVSPPNHKPTNNKPTTTTAADGLAPSTSSTCSFSSSSTIIAPLLDNPLRAGPGGRSSVAGVTAAVFGGTGFVGRYVVNSLARAGCQVICPHRSVEEKAMPLRQMGDLGQVVTLRDWHLRDDDATKRALDKATVVVNLIGQTVETRNFTYEQVHTEWPEKLAKFTREVRGDDGLDRFVHFSDVGASPDSASRRMRTKAAGDALLLDPSSTGVADKLTIFRPTPIIGDEDDFLNNLLGQAKFSTLMQLVDGGEQRMAPTHVTDVAAAVVAALRDPSSVGPDPNQAIHYLYGPEVMTMRDLVDLVFGTLHETRDDNSVAVPLAIAKAMWAPLDAVRRSVPPGLPFLTNYMQSADWADEISEEKLPPALKKGLRGKAGPGSAAAAAAAAAERTYADLGVAPQRVTEGLAVEALRFGRTGGYSLGDTKELARGLPASVKRYFGMDH